MKKMISALFALAVICSSAPMLTDHSTETAAVLAAAEDTAFDAEDFFVVVGINDDGSVQMRYYGEGDVHRVIWKNAPKGLAYGDVLVSDAEISMNYVQTYPDIPNLQMAYHYELGEGTELTNLGNCSGLMEHIELTITNQLYDGSGHWSIRLADADGKEYYYGLMAEASLGINLANAEAGDSYLFSFYQGKIIIPLEALNGIDIMGDINGDGTFSVSDVVLLQKWLLNVPDTHLVNWKAADFCKDGVLDVFDLSLMKRELLHKAPDTEINADIRTDEIQAYREMVWLMGMSDKPVILTSAQQLERNMSSLFRPEVVRALAKRYDDAFFKEHDLVLDFRIQGWGETQQLSVSDFSMTEDTIHIGYVRKDVEEMTDTAILLSQFVIPKITHSYEFDVTVEGETPLGYEFSTYTEGHHLYDELRIESYEMYESVKDDLPAAEQDYTKAFFEDHILYCYSVPSQAVAERQCYSVMKSGDTITIYTIQRNRVTDFLEDTVLDCVALNRADAEHAEIVTKTVNTNSISRELSPAGTTYYYAFPYDVYGSSYIMEHIAVNYNTFDGETQLTFYHITGDSITPLEYWEELQTIEYNAENPFTEDYEKITNADGSFVLRGDSFEITSDSIRYPAENGEMTMLTFAEP